MATYTTNLNLEKPDKTEQYSINVFNANADKIDNFAGLTPPRALTADKLTIPCKINGVTFDGSNNIISGLGLYSSNEKYNNTNIVYSYLDDKLKLFKSKTNENINNELTNENFWEEVKIGSNGAMHIGTVFYLNCSSSYVPEGCLSCDGAEYNKAQFEKLWDNYLIGKDVTYTLDNRLILGENVTINNGVISFENTEFNEFSFSEDIKDGKEIVINFIHDGSSGNEQRLLSNQENLYLSIINGYIGIASDSSFSGDSLELTQNNFFIKMKGTNIETSTVELLFSLSFDGIDFVEIGHWSTLLTVLPDSSKFSVYQFFGQIDLTKSYFSSDGTNKEYLCAKKTNSLLNTCTYSEYEADLTTYGQCGKFGVKPLEYDGSGLTIVGSPTITEDGIASGFVQGSNYIMANVNINASKLVIKNKFNYKVNTASNSMLYWFNTIALRQYIVNNGDLRIDGNSSPANLYINVPASNFREGDIVETELIIDTSVKLNIKVNGISINQYTSDRIPSLSNITQVGIGSSYYQGNNPYQGSIDLKGFSIEADGQTILSGGVGGFFKVPTIKDGAVVQQAMSDGELGKVYNEGLPDHTHSPIMLNGSNADDGDSGTMAITKNSESNGIKTMRNSSTGSVVETDVYTQTDDTSLNKVQMNAVALRYFVVVANGSINESQMNWSEWASSLQGKANKTDVDGQWVASELTLSTTVTAGTYTLDLSDYLPTDGYNYEVKIFGECFKEGSAASNIFVYTTIDNLTDNEIMATASSRRGRFYSIYTIDTSRTITMKIDVVVSSLQILAVAYRRIGRNV